MEEKKLNIELSATIAEGTYSNMSVISHSESEFVLDFLQIMPGVPQAKVKSRIVMTPENAKNVLSALVDNIQKYEQTYGEIRNKKQGHPIIGFNGGMPN